MSFHVFFHIFILIVKNCQLVKFGRMNGANVAVSESSINKDRHHKKTSHPKHKTCFIVQKPSCYEEQAIDVFAVKKNILKAKKSRLEDNTKTQVRHKMRTHARIIHPFTLGYLCYLPFDLPAVHSKLHKPEPFHISKEADLCVDKRHGVSLHIGIYHRIAGLCHLMSRNLRRQFETFSSSLRGHRRRTVLCCIN